MSSLGTKILIVLVLFTLEVFSKNAPWGTLKASSQDCGLAVDKIHKYDTYTSGSDFSTYQPQFFNEGNCQVSYVVGDNSDNEFVYWSAFYRAATDLFDSVCKGVDTCSGVVWEGANNSYGLHGGYVCLHSANDKPEDICY